MVKLKMDFGLSVDDMLDLSDRDGVLLALHLFQVKSNKSKRRNDLEKGTSATGIECSLV